MALITRRAWLAGAAASGLLVACGGNASGRSEGAAPSGRKRVRLTHGIVSLPKTRGVFASSLAAQGVDVEWLGPFPNHAPTLQAVATGSADFSFGGSSTPAMQAILSGSKLSIAAWSTTTPRTASIIVSPKSGIQSVRDLVGKTVAVNKAGLGEFLLIAALEKYGVPRDQVSVSYLNPPDAAPAFASGKVDAWSIWTGPLELAEVQYSAQRIFEDGRELAHQIDYRTYVVREDYAKAEPDVIRKVVAAFRADTEWENTHYAEAQKLAYADAKYPQAVVDKIASREVTYDWKLVDDTGISELQRAADWLTAHKVLSNRIDIAQHVVRL
ncbi:MAG: aliphatic sulfonate ABC transporter substrate-binding protein [Polyangiales bacterium]